MDGEELRHLLNLANTITYHCGNAKSIMRKIDVVSKGMKRDQKMRSYWECDQYRRRIRETFCVLNQRRVQAIVFSLDEMLELFRGLLQSNEDIRIGKFVRCKEDIHAILAKGVVYRTLNG